MGWLNVCELYHLNYFQARIGSFLFCSVRIRSSHQRGHTPCMPLTHLFNFSLYNDTDYSKHQHCTGSRVFSGRRSNDFVSGCAPLSSQNTPLAGLGMPLSIQRCLYHATLLRPLVSRLYGLKTLYAVCFSFFTGLSFFVSNIRHLTNSSFIS